MQISFVRHAATGLVALGLAAGTLFFPAANADAQDSAPGIFVIAPDTRATAQDSYPPEMLVGDFDGTFKQLGVYTSQSHEGSMVAFWESGPGALRSVDPYPVDEYCLVIEGELHLTDLDGTHRVFGPGDAFVIPKGWKGTWDMKTFFRKHFVTF